MRQGEISAAAAQKLKSLARPLPQVEGELLPTELFPLRAEVDRSNAARLAALNGQAYRFVARDSGSAPPDKRRRLLDNMTAVGALDLKHDAQVMLVKNVSETLVNGSVGKVMGFCKDPASLQKKTDARDDLLPLVEFRTFKGKEHILVGREEFRAEDSEGNLLARRVQVSCCPLVTPSGDQLVHFAAGGLLPRPISLGFPRFRSVYSRFCAVC